MNTHTTAPATPSDDRPWRCRQCGTEIGRVVAGVLRLGVVKVLPGATVECPTCGYTRTWQAPPAPAPRRVTPL